ncbi:MAG: Gfo/Idh/MocA family oxidoreductase [Treponema sp.]|nr:Gfo/Idh/MocA family oxidoreductase [Treponema sp.]
MTIGTVGTNFIVDAFIQAAAKTGGAEICACYSRSKETAAAFAEKHRIPRWYAGRKQFLSDTELDFIYVAAPNSIHFKWTRDALMAGRNVICEKPFVSKAAELGELMAIAKKKTLFLFEALTTPHLPNFRLLKQKLSEIGTIRLVQMTFSQYSSRYDAYLSGKLPNVFNPAFSGGALMDLNYYNLSFLQRLFGSPLEIRYFANKGESGIDTSGILILRYDGFIASASAAKDSESRNYIQIQGEKGYLASISTAGGLHSGFSLVTKEKTEVFNIQEHENVLYYELMDFIEEWNAGDPACCDTPLRNSLETALLMDQARKDSKIIFEADKL